MAPYFHVEFSGRHGIVKGTKMTGVQHDKRNQRRVRSAWGENL